MKMPPNSPDMATAVDKLHQQISHATAQLLGTIDALAHSGIADKRWCAIARTHCEEGEMALHRSLRDYPGDDPNNYGKVPLTDPDPASFAPPSDMPDQYGRDRNIAPPAKAIDFKDYTPGQQTRDE